MVEVVKCRNCDVNMEKQGKIAFGTTWYHKFVCPTCNTNEHRIVQNDIMDM
jgi:Zn finger protein HypA/HybF involved in hydrogenase expression